jgi:hypothetical protein
MCAVLRGREKRITAAVADPAYHTLIGNKGGGGGTRQDENVLQSSSQVRRLRFVSPPPMLQAACIQAPTHTVSKPHRVLVTTDSRGRAPQCVPVFKYSATLITSPPGQQVLPSAATASPHSCWVWFLTAGGGLVQALFAMHQRLNSLLDNLFNERPNPQPVHSHAPAAAAYPNYAYAPAGAGAYSELPHSPGSSSPRCRRRRKSISGGEWTQRTVARAVCRFTRGTRKLPQWCNGWQGCCCPHSAFHPTARGGRVRSGSRCCVHHIPRSIRASIPHTLSSLVTTRWRGGQLYARVSASRSASSAGWASSAICTAVRANWPFSVSLLFRSVEDAASAVTASSLPSTALMMSSIHQKASLALGHAPACTSAVTAET